MAYKVIVSLRAQKEIENAIDYYALYSNDAPRNFITTLKEAYQALATDPFLRIRYKNIRALKSKNFHTCSISKSTKQNILFGYYRASIIKEILIKDQSYNV